VYSTFLKGCLLRAWVHVTANMITVMGKFLGNFQMHRKSLGVNRKNSSLGRLYTLRVRIWRPLDPLLPLKFFDRIGILKIWPPFTRKYGNEFWSFFAFRRPPFDPLQSLKFSQKFGHYILRKLAWNMPNVLTTAVRKHVLPLHVTPSSKRIVIPT